MRHIRPQRLTIWPPEMTCMSRLMESAIIRRRLFTILSVLLLLLRFLDQRLTMPDNPEWQRTGRAKRSL
jgi:hypothetical protein